MKIVQPSIQETAFSCPHCGAYTSQTWSQLFSEEIGGESKKPFLPNKDMVEALLGRDDIPQETLIEWKEIFRKLDLGLPFTESLNQGKYIRTQMNNLWICKCFNCGDFSVWVHDRMVYPSKKQGSLPNADLPQEIKRDVEEARSILELSPRGSAAILRLSIQKLCAHLGEKGKNIDDDIASLVKKGLNPIVQQSLDVVRVIGNEAVHPGVIDLRDDRSIAERLFDLVNLIADQMITHPQTVKSLYEKLPASKREAIEKRDK